jgi:hypothetical protein
VQGAILVILMLCFMSSAQLMTEEFLGSDKICPASNTYIHVLSLCHLYTLPIILVEL